MTLSARTCILLALAATSPYTVGYLIPSALAAHRQTTRYIAEEAKKKAEAEHLDDVACGRVPPDELAKPVAEQQAEPEEESASQN